MPFDELKRRQAAMWGAGPFERIAHTLGDMHDLMIDSIDAGPDDLWLDIGCGTGELAFLATRTGATIHGADLSPTLVDTARRQAAERGHDIAFEVADCEELPFEDGTYDVVTSSVGAIFAPDHPKVASELARVLRPGGRLGLTAWTTDGPVGEFFQLIGSYAPPPPDGAGSAIAWGDPAYCEEMLGDDLRARDLASRRSVGGRVGRRPLERDGGGVRPDRRPAAIARRRRGRLVPSGDDRAVRADGDGGRRGAAPAVPARARDEALEEH